ncbi:MAG TPA: TIGR04282 family arsenosugar biosynthesis glycosyltransferase [Burkholderiales bacterium]|nr:TIGR04282 family arsenosugar biosynthesis glycosyltransferase [Burkholderiales bacterium]
MKAGCTIIVFARAPLAGRAKTRLAARIGADAAARLQARLARHALVTARRAARGAVELHGTPGGRHALFRGWAARYRVRLRTQRGGDLGERMQRALAGALRTSRTAVLIGSDCPVLVPADLRRAARLLAAACDVVVAPAQDGGYALIGARRMRAPLFRGITWGGDSVCRDTAANARALGLRWRTLRTVWDVDRPEDLDRLPAVRLRR